MEPPIPKIPTNMWYEVRLVTAAGIPQSSPPHSSAHPPLDSFSLSCPNDPAQQGRKDHANLNISSPEQTNSGLQLAPSNSAGLDRMTQASSEQYKRMIKAIDGLEKPSSEEYEKMISGSPFRILLCPVLQARKLLARRFCNWYNDDSLIPVDHDLPLDTVFKDLRLEREKRLGSILGSVGENTTIEPPFNFQYGFNITIGHRSYSNVNFRIHDSAPVTIGDGVLIGPNVTIITERHDIEIQSRRDGIVYAQPVTIGDDCWIATGATILPGVTIGNGCVIGAGSVVTRDIPPYSVAWGVPARVEKRVEDATNQI